jgi:hypothetical protein
MEAFVKKRLRRVAIMFVLACVLAPQLAQAGVRPKLGARLGAYEDDFFLGVDLLADVAMLHANPNFEWVFIDGGDLFTINADAYINIFPFPAVHPWAGGGLAFMYFKPDNFDSNTDVGVNLIAGAGFTLPMDPYVMIKYIIIEGDDTFVVAAGIHF